jgi:hypothetical protein
MDYKYIEQLLEKYWNCETSVEEEQILRSFFRQKELPEHLLRYKSLFAYQEAEKDIKLGDDFDSRILAEIVPVITPDLFKKYVDEGVIQGGMIPKLENSFSAVEAGVSQVVITLASAIDGKSGTIIKK